MSAAGNGESANAGVNISSHIDVSMDVVKRSPYDGLVESFAQSPVKVKVMRWTKLFITAGLIFTGHLPAAVQANAQREPASLAPASAAELQELLKVQNQQTAVRYSDHKPQRIPADAFDRLFLWNEIALDTTAIDHTPVSVGELRVFGEQFGPTRSSRAMAVVHIAMFEAVNAVTRKYHSYTHLAGAPYRHASIDDAIAEASHDALVAMYPSQAPRLDALLQSDLETLGGTAAARQAGTSLGKAAAASIVNLRKNDRSAIPEPAAGGPFTPIGGAGHWTPDPVSGLKLYLGAYWGKVTPFVLASSDQFRAPPPPALNSPAYTKVFEQAKTLGGDPRLGTVTTRAHAETLEGIFWSYDGTPSLCAPPRLYNQVARAIVLQHRMNDVSDAARMLALINTAMADAAISAWETKWYYQFWRPVTGIRSLDQGGNHTVKPDANWYPLGAQATNTRGPNFTPPFPAYVSGHATIGGALFQILRHYYPDASPFEFTSDEWNGLNKDASGSIRPLKPVYFSSFTEAEKQNADSRIWLGVHWQMDADQGVIEGHEVADWVWEHAFRPVAE